MANSMMQLHQQQQQSVNFYELRSMFPHISSTRIREVMASHYNSEEAIDQLLTEESILTSLAMKPKADTPLFAKTAPIKPKGWHQFSMYAESSSAKLSKPEEEFPSLPISPCTSNNQSIQNNNHQNNHNSWTRQNEAEFEFLSGMFPNISKERLREEIGNSLTKEEEISKVVENILNNHYSPNKPSFSTSTNRKNSAHNTQPKKRILEKEKDRPPPFPPLQFTSLEKESADLEDGDEYHHFRKEAIRQGRKRNKLYLQAVNAYQRADHSLAKHYSAQVINYLIDNPFLNDHLKFVQNSSRLQIIGISIRLGC
eukprot:TRINITY_DN2463_c0_g1_i1.p1 TRINITY_DN2463_c0_g1~~TRINITY_DN2463_c0_g1_i1.p1  ORF type:complete len:312 (-),score=53.24 TRINITY_DN2463_c0_g1_i1:341-1276(-)